MKRLRLSPAATMALAALGLVGTMSLVAEKIPFLSGLGFDGVQYAWLAKNFTGLFDGTLRLDYVCYNRFLPSLLCGLTLSGLGIPLEDRNIVLFFECFNVTLLTGCAWLWARVAGMEGFSDRARWLGFVALFCSHATLKYNVYYATLTDVTAMTLGLAMLWAYRRGSNAVLLAATAVGAMTWPTLLFQGLLLWLFPYRPAPDTQRNGRGAPWASAILAVALLAYLVREFFVRGEVPLPGTLWPLGGAAIEAAYVGGAAFFLFNDRMFYSPRLLASRLKPVRLLAAVLAVAALPAVLFKITGFQADYLGSGMAYIYQSVRLGMKYPGEFLVAHALYFGPWVLMLLFLFPKAARLSRKGGPGMALLCLMTVIQSLTPLSRQLIAGMPFFVFLMVGAADGEGRLGRRFLPWFAVLSLLYSKAWMRFSVNPADPEKTFSFNWYVSSTGCWMTLPFYAWQAAAVALTALLLWLFLSRAGMRPD